MAYDINSRQLFWITVLLFWSVTDLIICQAVTICRDSYYLHENECIECPQTCELCVSNTSCTKCKNNQYGPACQMTCKTPCSHNDCHKRYGYCTFGCSDGLFPSQKDDTCEPCPTGCERCSSTTQCFVCQKGFYGEACQNRCPSTCGGNGCDQSSGECFDCVETYFVEDGICKKCPDGCSRCDETTRCTKCQDGFYGPIEGTCFVECSETNGSLQFLAVTSEDICGVSEEHMPHDKNVCEKPSECQTRRFCVRYCNCSSDDTCSGILDNLDGEGVCATIKRKTCVSKCKESTKGKTYSCNRTCTVTEPDNTTIRSVCFHNTKVLGDSGIIKDTQNSTAVNCFSKDSQPTDMCDTFLDYKSWRDATIAMSIVACVACVAWFVLLCTLIVNRKMRIQKRRRVGGCI